MDKRKLSDEELRAAADEVMRYELELFRRYDAYPDHPFRDEMKTRMEDLCRDVENGNIKAARYHMGFTFYAKRCIAALLLIFTLACITIPEVVAAGYQKLIEIVETVFEEYTRFEYSNSQNDNLKDKFVALKVKHFSDNWMEVKKEIRDDNLELVYMNDNNQYFIIYQKVLSKNYKLITTMDTEKHKRNIVKMKGEKVELIYYTEEEIYFIWIHDGYYISGQTDSSQEELIKFLEHIEW